MDFMQSWRNAEQARRQEKLIAYDRKREWETKPHREPEETQTLRRTRSALGLVVIYTMKQTLHCRPSILQKPSGLNE